MNKQFALSGMTGVLLSSGTIVGMAAWRSDGYSHLTKAVSELGSTDAPLKEAFNLLGYILPGLLIAAFFYGLSKAFAPGARRWPLALLAASGLFMSLAGLFPMDMAHRTAPTSLLHTVGSLGSGVAWVLGAAWLGPLLRQQPAWAGLARPLGIIVWVAVPLIVLVPVLFPDTPALGQRVAFSAYFVFIMVLATRLYLTEPAKQKLPVLDGTRGA